MASKQVCEGCGSIYDVTKHKIIMRDKDSINCEVCGRELIAWNGAVIYNAKLIERGTPPTGPLPSVRGG